MERLTDEVLAQITNETVFKALLKARSVLLHHKKIGVSVSGGSDSDIVLDMIERCKNEENEIHYVWFNTGVEYQATKDHLIFLEKKYNVTIERLKAEKTIPTCCKEYGQPFLSKYNSKTIEGLQRHGFQWEDEPFEVLIEKYPKATSYLKWWCNYYTKNNNFKNPSCYDIGYTKYLKEFMVANPPRFKVSSKCCDYAKKKVAKKWYETMNFDLTITGIRKNEGGIRSIAYKSCYTHDAYSTPTFRPVFWFSDGDKAYYDEFFGIVHSNCYTLYGMKRTGCVGCPFNIYLERDLQSFKEYEPKLFIACNNIFKDSYEYAKRFKEFRETKKQEEKGPR